MLLTALHAIMHLNRFVLNTRPYYEVGSGNKTKSHPSEQVADKIPNFCSYSQGLDFYVMLIETKNPS